ncbi:MAG TPA: hypothetical protein VFO34_01100 [Candidatus Acidoferrales bacterium]|nr:hypothetical protein [Candidatus Acidoferrales bacterium]
MTIFPSEMTPRAECETAAQASPRRQNRSVASYEVYSLRLASDFPLPELILSGGQADVELRKSAKQLTATNPFMVWTAPSGEMWLSFYKLENKFLLRFSDIAEFAIDVRGSRIDCVRRDGVPETTFRHLLLDQVLPMVIQLRGGEALHSSAVVTPEGAIAFCGPTGSGKSTLAAIFCRAGDTLLTDDCLAISESGGELYAAPGYPGFRLWNEIAADFGWENRTKDCVAHYTSKRRVKQPDDAAGFPREAARLRAIYILEREDARDYMSIEEMSARDQMMGLLSYCFRLDTTNRARLAQQFRTMERYSRLVRVRRIRLPRNPQRIGDIRERILADTARAERLAV